MDKVLTTPSGGLVRVFADFSALPNLLDLIEPGDGPEQVSERWLTQMRDEDVNLGHVEKENLLSPNDPYPELVEDALRFCMAWNLVLESGAVSPDVRLFLEGDKPESEIVSFLRHQIEEHWRIGANGVEIVPLLEDGAKRVADAEAILGTGLLLCEMACLIAWAGAGSPGEAEAHERLAVYRKLVEKGIREDKEEMSQIFKRRVFADGVSDLCFADPQIAELEPVRVMGLTEARATAMLLVHLHVFDLAIPLGPTNCLVKRLAAKSPDAPSDDARYPVLAKTGGIVENEDVDALEVVDLTFALLEHNVSKAGARVYPQLGIDMKTRRAVDTVSDTNVRGTRQWRIINKALSMELLCSELLARIDHAETVHAQLEMRNGHPFRHAQSGDADIEVQYPQLASGETFSLVAEVSARRRINGSGLRKQLEQALKHGQKLHSGSKGPVCAVVINDGRIGSDPQLQKVYREFIAEHELEGDGPVRVVPLCALDLAAAVEDIVRSEEPESLRFGTDELYGTLIGFAETLLSGDLPGGDWMREAWVEAASSGGSLTLDS